MAYNLSSLTISSGDTLSPVIELDDAKLICFRGATESTAYTQILFRASHTTSSTQAVAVNTSTGGQASLTLASGKWSAPVGDTATLVAPIYYMVIETTAAAPAGGLTYWYSFTD